MANKEHEPMSAVQISAHVSNGDFRSLWLDMIKTMPQCHSCNRVATQCILPDRYACSDHMTEGYAWGEVRWIDHVIAARIMGLLD